jgi:hypothetical protein
MTVHLGCLGPVGLLHDRTETAIRAGAFLRTRCMLDGYIDGAVVWARVCGHGVAVMNTRFARPEGPEDGDMAVALGPFRFRMLTPRSRVPRIDAAAARQLHELARRHAGEASAYHEGRALEDLSVEELRAWCAALARGTELDEI